MSEAENAYAEKLRALKALYSQGLLNHSEYEKKCSDALGQNILHEELGYFSDVQIRYNLEKDQVDRLIAHSREDIAATRGVVGSTLDFLEILRIQQERTTKHLRWMVLISMLNLVMVIFILANGT